MLLARRLVNGRERGCLQVVSCSVLRLVNMSTRAMRLKTQARALACLQVVYLTLSVVKEQSLSASLVRLEKELFPLYLVCKYASLQTVSSQQSSTSTSTGCMADAVVGRAIPCFPPSSTSPWRRSRPSSAKSRATPRSAVRASPEAGSRSRR